MNTFASTARGTEIGDSIRRVRHGYTLSEEIARKFMLASALEPLADKQGCTTRFVDLKDSKRLEWFIAAGINSGFAVTRFVTHLERHRALRGGYGFLTEAVVASRFNRGGGKINQGILETVFPLIAAQVVYYPELKEKPFDIFPRAAALLRLTCRGDVDDLIEAKEVANRVSGVEKKYPVRRHNTANVFEYYERETAIEKRGGKTTGVLHNAQFVEGFPDVCRMLRVMCDSRRERLLEKSEDAYWEIRRFHDEKIGVGLAADYCAVCIYLYISLIDHREVI